MLHRLTFLPAPLRWSLARKAAWQRFHRDAQRGHPKALAQFKARHGYAANLAAPATHSERTYLRKLRDHDPRFPLLTDKVKARSLIDAILGAGSSKALCVPILAQAECFEDLPATIWSQDVILKCTHGSGMNCIVRQGDPRARRKARRLITRWLGRVHGARRFEWAYFDLAPSVIAEPLLAAGGVTDVKLYYYDGQLRFVMPEINGADRPAIAIYSPDWDRLPMQWDGFANLPCDRPAHLDEMIRIATPLAQGFDMIRIDFMATSTRFYLGELTLYDGSGLARCDSHANDRAFAHYWRQPHLGVDTGQTARNASCTAAK